MVKNWHQPKSFALKHDSLVNPAQNLENPSTLFLPLEDLKKVKE